MSAKPALILDAADRYLGSLGSIGSRRSLRSLGSLGSLRDRAPSSYVHVAMRRSAEPRSLRVAHAFRVSSDPPPVSASPCRVVVVDADRRVRRDLAGLVDLADGCASVGVAGDTDSALAVIRRERPDVVVLDPRLPDVESGMAFVSRVRHESDARIVVIGNDPALAARARSVGAHDFVTKDAQLTPLIEAIVRSDGRPEKPVAGPPESQKGGRDG